MIIIIITLIILTILVIYTSFCKDESIYFIVSTNKNDNYKINYWFDEVENQYYVFLPTFANLKEIKIHPGENEINIGKTVYQKKDKLQKIKLNRKYKFKISNSKETLIDSSILFLQSENIATMFINTDSKTTDKIYEDKTYKESANMALISGKGLLEYKGRLNYIKGRGNTTWNRNKKPFNIQLNESMNLLGMEKAKNWTLIANQIDKTNLKNKLVLDFANEINLSYSPKSEYIDLYVNDEYLGLYLLTEKIEIDKNRIDIKESTSSDITGGYLLELEVAYRASEEKYRFITSRNQNIIIKQPDCDSKQLNYISKYWQKLEDAIYDENSTNYTKYIDLDSWVKKYIVEELFANFDANNTSTYFYKVSDDDGGLIYAGPVWDYDGSLGALHLYDFPNKYIVNEDGKLWNELLKKDTFYKKVKNQYNKILPKIEDILNSKIDNLSEKISESTKNNNIRWKNNIINTSIYVIYPTIEENINHLKTFLSKRIEFLNNEWKEK